MPLGGETVGTAYVRILADGSGLDESIRQGFDDNADVIEGQGEKDVKRYAKTWDKEMKKSPNRKLLTRSLEESLAKADLADAYFGSAKWQKFRKQLKERFGEAGALAGKNLEEAFVVNPDFNVLRRKLSNIVTEVHKATEQIQREESKSFRDMTAENSRQVTRLRKLFENYTRDVEKMTRGEKVNGTTKGEMIRNLQRLRGFMDKAGGATHEFTQDLDDLEKKLRFSNPNLVRAAHGIGVFSDGIGKAFGKGSRNNFLNFIGSMVGGIVNLLQIIPRAADAISDFGQTIARNFNKSVADGASNGVAAFEALATAALELAPAIAAVAIGMAALTIVIGPIVGIFSSLLGIVTALAASLAFALAGAVVAVGGALGALGIAAGIAVAAFLTMNKAMKSQLTSAFKGLKNEVQGAGKAFLDLALPHIVRDIKAMGPVLKGLTPLFRGIGGAVGGLADYFTRAIQGPGFKQFRNALQRDLPGIVTSLGRSFGNALGGLGGVFRAALPFISDFSNWLEKVTGKFATFANSAKGQKTLKKFFDDAGQSARKVGDFLGTLGDLIGELFKQGKGTGDDIFADMTRGVTHLVDYLTSHPDAVNKWFGDALELSRNIGHIVDGLVNLADAFDNASTRAQGSWIVQKAGDAFNLLADAVAATQFAIGQVAHGIGGFGSTFAHGITMAVQGLGDLGKTIGGIIFGHTLDIPDSFFSKIRGLGAKIVNFFGKPVLPTPQLAMPRIASFGTLAPRILKLVGKIHLPVPTISLPTLKKFGGIAKKIIGLVGRTVLRTPTIGLPGLGKFKPIAKNIIKIVGTAVLHTPIIALPGLGKFSSIPGKIIHLVGSIHLHTPTISLPSISGFYGLAGRIISAVGNVVIHPHISMPHIPGTAVGGVFEGLRGMGVVRRIGEAGAEAVVPLNRPLSQVDPAVRMLSAFAQGKLQGMAGGGVVGGGRTIEVGGITVVTPNTDTQAVAVQVVNRLVAAAY